MGTLKKLFTFAIILSTLCTSNLSAEECATLPPVVEPNEVCWGGTDGCAYAESCTSPCLTPAIALGVIAVIAIVAVVIQNNNGGTAHTHN